MATPRHIPTCYRWDNKEVSFDYLQSIYGFQYHEAENVPASATKAWYPTVLQEAHGNVAIKSVIAGGGAAMRVEVPPTGYTELSGSFSDNMKMGDHSYFPGGHGPYGFRVINSVYPSVYVDGFGILWGGHQPDQLPPPDQGNNYMHLNIVWGLVDLATTSTPPVIPPSDPTPITGGIWLTAGEVQSIRSSLLNVDDILRDATNRKPA